MHDCTLKVGRTSDNVINTGHFVHRDGEIVLKDILGGLMLMSS